MALTESATPKSSTNGPRLQLGYSFWNPFRFARVRCSSPQFDIRQYARPRLLAHFSALDRTTTHSAEPSGQSDFQLAKVGVVGSNPIARSNILDIARMAERCDFSADRGLGYEA